MSEPEQCAPFLDELMPLWQVLTEPPLQPWPGRYRPLLEGEEKTVTDRPNILFLFTDQQCPDWFEMNPEIPVRTPPT